MDPSSGASKLGRTGIHSRLEKRSWVSMDNETAEKTLETIYLAGGCFWGIERILWRLPGVVSTATGYMGGTTASPTYAQVCSGLTGHAETVRVTYDPRIAPTAEVVATFFENHDPTTLNRQGNDRGTQYRSAVWTTSPEQYRKALAVLEKYQQELTRRGYGTIVTEVHAPPPPCFFMAESYHQRYLEKNPDGYCNHGFNGVSCPRGLAPRA